jgi:hypothetical protein
VYPSGVSPSLFIKWLLTEGAIRNGASEVVASAVFAQLKAFGGYSFRATRSLETGM